jgi:hypothetical protein
VENASKASDCDQLGSWRRKEPQDDRRFISLREVIECFGSYRKSWVGWHNLLIGLLKVRDDYLGNSDDFYGWGAANLAPPDGDHPKGSHAARDSLPGDAQAHTNGRPAALPAAGNRARLDS